MKRPFIIALSSALATAALIKAAPALAQPTSDRNVSVVRTADLDLSTTAGRRALDHRLTLAAAEVCGTASEADLAGQNAVHDCRLGTIAKARAEGAQLASRSQSIILVAASR